MRRGLAAILSASLLLLACAIPALAADDMCASGADFGAMHAAHAQDGMLGGDMNPGMHRGYSVCLP